MPALAARFDERSFLPARANIRHFCEMYGIEASASGSRAGAIPGVFEFLADTDPGELRRHAGEKSILRPPARKRAALR